jgi:hypothetical protein
MTATVAAGRNVASCGWIGAQLVEIVALPGDNRGKSVDHQKILEIGRTSCQKGLVSDSPDR